MEAAEVAIDITGSKSKIKLMENNPAFGMRGTCLNTKARSLLGYEPSIDIEDGFANTWEWLKHKL